MKASPFCVIKFEITCFPETCLKFSIEYNCCGIKYTILTKYIWKKKKIVKIEQNEENFDICFCVSFDR